jgi:uncharacterized protein (UPF0335 family)
MAADGDSGVIESDALRGYVSRVSQLHDERDEINESIRNVYGDAKDAGFDTTLLREIVREHRTDAEARSARYAKLDAYRRALGMLADTPLGSAAFAVEMERPRPFAEQPIGTPRRRGRPRKTTDPVADAMKRAQDAIDMSWQDRADLR